MEILNDQVFRLLSLIYSLQRSSKVVAGRDPLFLEMQYNEATLVVVPGLMSTFSMRKTGLLS